MKIDHPYDPHDLWSSLNAEARLDLLLNDVSNLSRQIQVFSDAVQQQWDEFRDVWQSFFPLGTAVQSLQQTVAAIEWAKTHPPSGGGGGGGGVTPPPPKKPQISAKETKSGTFEITGSGFLSNAVVRLRAADKYANQLFTDVTNSDGTGKIDATMTFNCTKGATIFFSATDDRADPTDIATGVLWSNYPQVTC